MVEDVKRSVENFVNIKLRRLSQGQATNSVGVLLDREEELKNFWKEKSVLKPFKERKERPCNTRECVTLLDGSTMKRKREKQTLANKAKELVGS